MNGQASTWNLELKTGTWNGQVQRSRTGGAALAEAEKMHTHLHEQVVLTVYHC